MKAGPLYMREVGSGSPLTECVSMDIPEKPGDGAVVHLILNEPMGYQLKQMLRF
ncbi:hypothetical protein V8C42DRAFT_336646 [Trichoderma barbatum]